MSAPYFYHHPVLVGAASLTRQESAHAGGSRRLRVGDVLIVVDGRGRIGKARVTGRSRERVDVEITAVQHAAATALAGLTIVTALPRGKRQDFLFEKCAELGVGRLVATNFERSVARAKRSSICGWTRTSREAMKQSRQSWMPTIKVCETPSDAIDRVDDGTARLVAMPGPDVPMLAGALGGTGGFGSVCAVIGPEGGFTDQEAELFREAGFVPFSLGRSVLRIETACVSLASQVLSGSNRSW